MVSQTATYALLAAACLAAEHLHRATATTVAEATGVPPQYMSKVLSKLVRSGLVRSQRGPSGGFELARPAEEITLLEIVRAVDTDWVSPPPITVGGGTTGPTSRVYMELGRMRRAAVRDLQTLTLEQMVKTSNPAAATDPAFRAAR